MYVILKELRGFLSDNPEETLSPAERLRDFVYLLLLLVHVKQQYKTEYFHS